MTYQNIRLGLHIPKIYTFEISPFVWIQTFIVVEEVLNCIMAIIDYRKSIIHMTLKMGVFDPFLKSNIYAT